MSDWLLTVVVLAVGLGVAALFFGIAANIWLDWWQRYKRGW